MPAYDGKFYRRNHPADSVAGFMRIANDLQRLSTKYRWPVERKFNKYYCGFKVGNYVVFGVKWLGGKSYGLFFKVPERSAKKVHAPSATLHRYEAIWKQAVFRVEDGKTLRVGSFLPILKEAVKLRSE